MKPLPSEALFGRGLMKISGGDKTFTGHCGDTCGTHSVLMYDEEYDCCIAFSLNGTTYSPLVVFDEIVTVLFSDDFQSPQFRKPVTYSLNQLTFLKFGMCHILDNKRQFLDCALHIFTLKACKTNYQSFRCFMLDLKIRDSKQDNTFSIGAFFNCLRF